MGLQIFGTRKRPDTRKAERFFRERGVAYQFVDLAEKGISCGELAAIAAAAGVRGMAALVDIEGKRFRNRGLAYQDYDAEAEILADPLLLREPIVRDGRRVVIGADPAGWKALLGG